jgi:transketolase
MMGVASGLALAGKNPWVVSYAVFNPERNLDQLRTAVYSQLNIKVVGGHAGLATGRYGSTHQALEDLAIMCSLPGMTAVVPADFEQALSLTKQLHKIKTPGYLRLSRLAKPSIITDQEIILGRAQKLIEGSDLTIFACGLMVQTAIEAVTDLEEIGLSVELINLHTVKPLDSKAIIDSINKTGAAIVIQEHQTHSGLNSSLAQIVAEKTGKEIHKQIAFEFMGVTESFGESGSEEELYKKHGLDKLAIIKKVKLVLEKKKKLNS